MLNPQTELRHLKRKKKDSNLRLLDQAPSLEVEGCGIHTGKRFRVKIQPAKKGQGVLFRAQVGGLVYEGPALWSRLSGTSRATALVLRAPGRHRVELKTVEHFIAAVSMLGYPSLVVTVEPLDPIADDMLELPILDGSSQKWWSLLCAFAQESSLEMATFAYRVKEPFVVEDGLRRVEFSPPQSGREYRTDFICEVNFRETWIQSTSLNIDWQSLALSQEQFSRQTSRARTFGFQDEVQKLQAKGLALGGSLENAILLSGNKVVNDGGFLFPTELADHKLLDAIGDFALSGAPILGQIRLVRAGHDIHARALTEIMRKGIVEEVSLPLRKI